ncbi:D-alanyl-D-alanine carboxypeptidase/D-alanyl-D-alanine endopeptidase [Oceanobacillus jeddahense]|uniref:D-alanyl-D-alanine carboxypeptidase/D-alanyl-D-alanine endopeptidase n=1 Tax=Oceanobacillus jeddahense TaxID=1462527 RepID=UPI00363AAF88
MEKLNDFLKNTCNNEGSILGLSIRSSITGKSLYDYFASTRLQPASNLKILTAVAALRKLGSDYTFQTELYTDGEIVNETCHGNIFLIGKGDPTLQEKDYLQFITSLKEKGIRQISGDFILDDTWYDDERWSDDLIWADQQYAYGAEVSALTLAPDEDYDTNAIKLKIAPGMLNTAPSVSILPHSEGITITNTAVTTEEADEEDLIIKRDFAENHFFISGKIGIKEGKQDIYMAIKGAENFIAKMIRQILKNTGIVLEGRIKRGKTKTNVECIYQQQSLPLSKIMIPFMKLSNNGIGEMLTKELGRIAYGDGSWESGISAVKETLASYQINLETIQLKDGSGISAANFVPAGELTRLLFEIQQEKWFPVFLTSLPIAGEADKMVGGTLRNRMKGRAVQAKTGTIEGVSTLSGYVTNVNGERLIFSILFNHLLDADKGKDLEDELVTILAEIGDWG